MLSAKSWQYLLLELFLLLCGVSFIQGKSVTNDEWFMYKAMYAKIYPTAKAEAEARYAYGYNLNFIQYHNKDAAKGMHSYYLAPNQFTDMPFYEFNALFPQKKRQPPKTGATDLPVLSNQTNIPSAYHPNSQGVTPNVYDQGTSCGSSWAYATTAAIEIYNTLTLGTRNVPLSAQQFIDCASLGQACTGQVPQAAFDYMTMYSLKLKTAMDYPNDNKIPSPCRAIGMAEGVTLSKYSDGIADGHEEMLKAYVSSGLPVVIEFNPTSFEFMHYSSGVFQQPCISRGSHYMVVVGYDDNSWILLNSFGRTWGEGGYMRLRRSDINAKLPKSATLPTEI